MNTSVPSGSLPRARPVAQYIDLLACPACGKGLRFEAPNLVCDTCRRPHVVRDNIPDLYPPATTDSPAWDKWKEVDAAYQERYRSWTKEKHLGVLPLVEDFFDWCGMRDATNVNILDIGGGHGVWRVVCWRHPERNTYVDVDPRINMVHPFYGELHPRCLEVDFPYILGVGERLPLKSERFDLAIVMAAVDHWNRPVDVFNEIRRCLKPGGKLYVMTTQHTDDDHPAGAARVIKGFVRSLVTPGRRSPDKHMHHFANAAELTALLTMFTVARAVDGRMGKQIYVECVR